VAHVARVKQGESQSQGTNGHAKIDQRLGTHASRHSFGKPRQRPRSATRIVPRRRRNLTWATLIVTAKLSSSVCLG
jgi:hypothetical protein